MSSEQDKSSESRSTIGLSKTAALGTIEAGMKRKLLPEEIEILSAVAENGNGWEWVTRHQHLVLEQARAMGDLI